MQESIYMCDRIEFTDNDVTEITEGITEITVPVKALPSREWISRQLQELASKILIDQEITEIELKWCLHTNQYIVTTKFTKAK